MGLGEHYEQVNVCITGVPERERGQKENQGLERRGKVFIQRHND